MRDLAEVLRPIRIEAPLARSRFDYLVSRQQHRDRIARRMIITDPRQRTFRSAGQEDGFIGFPQVMNQQIDAGG